MFGSDNRSANREASDFGVKLRANKTSSLSSLVGTSSLWVKPAAREFHRRDRRRHRRRLCANRTAAAQRFISPQRLACSHHAGRLVRVRMLLEHCHMVVRNSQLQLALHRRRADRREIGNAFLVSRLLRVSVDWTQIWCASELPAGCCGQASRTTSGFLISVL